MKSRKEAAEFINSEKCLEGGDKAKHSSWRIGKRQIRALMDFIYDGKPKTSEEEIRHIGGE